LERFAKTRSGFLVFALAATLVAQSTLFAGRAYACSCAGFPTPLEELRSSDAVFVGKAVKNGLEDPNPRDNIMIGGIRFDVEKSWKGVSDDRVDLYGQSESYYGPPEEAGTIVENSCAVPFKVGKTYLVYASGGEGDGLLAAHFCGRTGPLRGADEELEALGPPTGPLPDTGGPGLLLPGATVAGSAILLLLVLTTAFSAGRWRRDADA
jgi:hypothetical protein